MGTHREKTGRQGQVTPQGLLTLQATLLNQFWDRERTCLQMKVAHIGGMTSKFVVQHPVTLLCLSFLLCGMRIIIYPQNPCEESVSYSVREILGLPNTY